MFSFDRKRLILFLNDAKLSIFLNEYLVWSIFSNICEVICKKHEELVCETWNFVCGAIRPCWEEKEKINFFTVQLFMVQISAKYLFTDFVIETYLESFFTAIFNWSPKTYSHPSNYLLELQLILVDLLA